MWDATIILEETRPETSLIEEEMDYMGESISRKIGFELPPWTTRQNRMKKVGPCS
jgi:hypothetical protein